MYDLNNLTAGLDGWQLQVARAINNQGQIVGIATDANFNFRGFILTPVAVPEPGALALFGVTVARLAVARRRRLAAVRADTSS